MSTALDTPPLTSTPPNGNGGLSIILESLDGKVSLEGLTVTTGGVVSAPPEGAVMETLSVALPLLPAASKAVAVHVAVVSAPTSGAV